MWQYRSVSGEISEPIRTAHDSAWLRRLVVETVIVFAAYYIAGKLGQATTHIRSSNLGPVWPAYGVALAAVILRGPRIWPALAAAAFLVAFQSPVPHIAAIGQAISATLAALCGGAMLRQAGFDPSLSRLRDALNLIVLGAAASAMISATLGTATLYTAGVAPYSGIASAWLVYWLGDGTGVLLVTPLILTAADLLRWREPARIGEFAALLVVVTQACVLFFGDLTVFPVRLRVLAFAVLPLVIWAAIRFGTIGVAIASLLIATIATVATALGYGPFSQDTPFVNAVLLDVFFVVLSVTGLILAAVIAERARAEQERERLVAEQAAMEARLRLAAIVESSDDAIVGLDLDGRITDWNAGAERLYGHRKHEVIGRPYFQLVQPGVAVVEQVPKGITKREAVHVRKDGSQVAISLTLSPIRNAAGRPVGESAIAHDATERNRATALREELAHLGRVSLLSALTGALAHEINQPLAAIRVNIDAARLILAREPLPVVELRDALDDIRSDNQRAGEVLQRIRALLRKDAAQSGPVEINETVGDVVKLTQFNATRRGIRVTCNLAEQALPVNGDRVQVQQVVLNLLMNACDAVQDNERGSRDVSLRTARGPGGMIISVKDSGAGLSDDELAHIFEPFYTTKSDGMGLGLSICRTIVAAHGGTLEAVRNPGRGMTFSATFPYWRSVAIEQGAQRQDYG